MSPSFQLKGSLFTLSVLQLLDNNLDKLVQELSDKVKLAPQFFQYAPVVVDLNQLNLEETPVDFAKLRQILRDNHLIPVGIRGATDAVGDSIHQAEFAVMQDADQMPKQPPSKEEEDESGLYVKPHGTTLAARSSLLITQPIRSGQQVYAQGGDLIVISTVSPGSELLADGNIHVYGTLRGRALAGINGDTNARIFCNHLEAELVSIAGQYKVFEEAYQADDSKVKQLYLEEDQLVISSLK